MKSCILLLCAGLLSGVNVSGAADPNEEKQIMGVLETMAQATINKDVATLARLYREDLIYGHSSGSSQTKAEVLTTVAGPSTTETMTFTNTTIRIYGSVGFVRGINDIRNVIQGKTRDNHLNILWILVKGPQGWQIVARQPSLAAQ